MIFCCFKRIIYPEYPPISALHYLILINELHKFFCSIFCYWIILGENLVKWKVKIKFWKILEQIDEQYNLQNTFMMRSYTYKLVEVILIVILADFVQLMMFFIIDRTAFFFIAIIKICKLRVFYYLLYVEIIKHQLKTIESYVRKMISSRNIRLKRCKSFTWIRDYYHLTYKLVECINSMFGLSQLATITFSFNILLCDLFFAIFLTPRGDVIRAIGTYHFITFSYLFF